MDKLTLERFDRMDARLERMTGVLEQIAAKEICIPPVPGLGALVEILTLQAATKENVWMFAHPKDGTKATLTTGTTDLNFDAGTITTPAGVVTKMSSSLQKLQKSFMESVALRANLAIVIQFDAHDKLPVDANEWFQQDNTEFARIRVTTTASTKCIVLASSAP